MASNNPVLTPRGKLIWVRISGEGEKKFQKPGEFEYVASVYMPRGEAEPFIRQLDSVYQQAHVKGYGKKNAGSGGYRFCDADGRHVDSGREGSATHVVFRFHTGTTLRDGSRKNVLVYNAAAQLIELGDKAIGNGSTGQIAGQASYYAIPDFRSDGITLYLSAIQIHDFVEYNPNPGFVAQKTGYVGPNIQPGPQAGQAGQQDYSTTRQLDNSTTLDIPQDDIPF